MQQTPWSMHQIKQCEQETGQAMLSDEHTLVFYAEDFGKLTQSSPSAVCIPDSVAKIQAILHYANQHRLPVTIRGKGLSQGGQSLPVTGGLTLHLQELNKVLDKESTSIWVEANSSWAQLLEKTLSDSQIPYVLPYNCNLSIGGVLSAAGIGASSFKYGSISAHVKALEVVLAKGEVQIVDAQSPLFHACLSGQGLFGVITKACIQLRPCLKHVRTFYFVYLDEEQWLNDLSELTKRVDYMEAFCSPALQGSKIDGGKRRPFAQWIYAAQVSIEYSDKAPEFADIAQGLSPWRLIHTQDESIHSYLHRHDPRFEMMKMTGQWELFHPWYECFMSKSILRDNLADLLAELPVHYVSLMQVVPLSNKKQIGFFMLPDEEEVFELMILNPGVNPALVKSCIEVIESLDTKFLPQGGKRYLSGYLGRKLGKNYWLNHFGARHTEWQHLRLKYDERQIFRSFLHSEP